jgi:hypothetical protein
MARGRVRAMARVWQQHELLLQMSAKAMPSSQSDTEWWQAYCRLN